MSTAPLQARAERLAETTWLGGPPRAFEKVGWMEFVLLLAQGMRPSSRVLDVGCGALRLGYRLMRFLDPGGYHGIEPQQQMLRIGPEQIVEPEVVEHANARFSDDDAFDFSVLDTDFDFVVARSIRHSFGWAAEAARSGLAVRQLPHDVVSHQYWLGVEHRT